MGRPPNGAAKSLRYTTLEAALRAAGCPLTRAQFYDVLDDGRQAFYPGWSEDELACHPRDALQFCEVVRLKANAPVPDAVIMRALLNRREQKQP